MTRLTRALPWHQALRVPVFREGRAKVELAVGRGKHAHDKRQVQKSKEADRAIRQAMMRRR